MYYVGKYWLKGIITVFMAIIIAFSVAALESFRIVKTQVDQIFPELVRLVGEDNCLDNTVLINGTTMYQSFRHTLDVADANSPHLEFRSDAIDVPYTSRATAPQKGTRIPVRLRGYWVATLPFGSGIQIEYPIDRELEVVGIRQYRDR